MNSAQEGQTGRRGRGKRQEVLIAATDRFGRDGYEHTKWADIAADIGVGATALYHYFESKQHCLYEIMDEAIADFGSWFVAIVAEERDCVRAIEAVLASCFDLSEHDVNRNRVLVAEQGRLSSPSGSEREEQARLAARARMRELEVAWGSFLATAMRDGAIAETDPRLLTRAVLGLYNSVWHWYRPNGIIPLPRIAEYYTELTLALLGLPPATPQLERAAA